MKRLTYTLALIWISGALITGCSTSKSKMFGNELQTMKEIHDRKFNRTEITTIAKPKRSIEETLPGIDDEFHWLPNPTLTMYVFRHLTPAGHPVPGYSTFFRLYTRSHIAEPGEQTGAK